MTQNESVLVTHRAAKGAKLDGEVIPSRLLATVTLPAWRVVETAALAAFRRRWRRLVNHTTKSQVKSSPKLHYFNEFHNILTCQTVVDLMYNTSTTNRSNGVWAL